MVCWHLVGYGKGHGRLQRGRARTGTRRVHLPAQQRRACPCRTARAQGL